MFLVHREEYTMKKLDLKSIFISTARALALYVIYALISLAAVTAFKLEVTEQRYYLIYGEVLEYEISFYCALAVCIILSCLIFAFSRWSIVEQIKYLDGKPKEFNYFFEAKKIICSFDFIIEVAVCTVFAVLFSNSLFLSDISKFIFQGKNIGNFLKNLLVVTIILLIEIISGVIHRVSSRKIWFDSKYCEEKSPVYTIIKMVVYIVLLAIFFIFIWVYVPVIPKNFPLILMVSQIILPIILVPLSIIILIQYIGAMRKRLSFIRRLKCTCKTENVSISQIKNKFSFIFFRNKGFNFKLKTNKNTYDCKFIASRQKGISVILDSDGRGLYVHTFSVAGAVLGQYYTRFKYAFESENKKLLIICPRPQEISIADSKGLHQADSGDRVGDYKLFSADGLIRAIEFDNIDA